MQEFSVTRNGLTAGSSKHDLGRYKLEPKFGFDLDCKLILFCNKLDTVLLQYFNRYSVEIILILSTLLLYK